MERAVGRAAKACVKGGGRTALLVAAVLVMLPNTIRAQQPLSLRGTVVRQTLDGEKAVAREQVTLHKVSSREAGPVDSAVTDARGGYAFRVLAPDSQSMYLVSARYGGIAYFSQPAQAGAPSAPSQIVVFDTTSGDVRVQLQGRHVVVSSPSADGIRSVIDVLEVENDTVVTRVAGASNRPTYSLLLPEGARNVRASQGEMGEGTVEIRNGRADLFAPLSPGLRQLVVTYELPPGVFPLAIPLERTVGVLEVLLEEPGATVAGGGLVSQGGVSVDGKTFTRYLGQNAPASAVLTLAVVGGGAGSSLPTWIVPLVLALATLGVIVLFARRSPATLQPAARAAASGDAPVAAAHPAHAAHAAPSVDAGGDAGPRDSARDPDVVTQLARRLAAVDAMLESESAVAGAARGELERYRAALKAQLVGALANHPGDR